jgi:hypothetical protein
MTISSHKDKHVLTLLVILQTASVKSVTTYKRYTNKTEYLSHIMRYKNGMIEL